MAKAILDLGARGDIGTSNDTAYADLSYAANLNLAAEFCSGFRLALGANATGRAAAGTEVADFLEASLEIEAGAALQIELAAQLSANVRDTVGLHVVVMAQLRAFVRARLSLGLTLEELAADILQRRNGVLGLHDRLLLALIDEVSLELGIEGSVQVAVAAQAVLSARICLSETDERKPGFDMNLSGGAAFLYGKEFGFFLRGRLPEIDRYLLRAVQIVSDDLLLRADGPADRFALRTLSALSETVVAGLSSKPGASGLSAAADSLLPLLQEALIDALVLAARQLLTDALADAGISPELAETLRGQLQPMLASGTPPPVTDLLPILATAAAHFDQPSDGADAHLLTVLSTQMYAIGYLFDPAAAAFDAPLPEHVLRTAGLPVGQMKFRDASDAISVLATGPLLDAVPELPEPANTLASAALTALSDAGISPFDILHRGTTPDPNAMKTAAVAFLGAVMSTQVVPRVDGLVAKAAAEGALPEGVAKAVSALLHGTQGLLLPLLADTLAGRADPKDSLERFGLVAAHIGATLLVEQVATLCAAAFSRSIDLLDYRIDQMQEELHAPDSQFVVMLVDTILGSLDDALPGNALRRTPRRAVMEREIIDMMDALLNTGRRAFGSETWSAPRIERLRDGLVNLLAGADHGRLDWANMTPRELSDIIDALDDCPALPEGWQTAVEGLSGDLRDVALIQARIFLLEVPGILARHLGNLFRELVLATIEEALRAGADAAQALADRIETLVEDVVADLERIEQKLQAALNRTGDEIEALRDAMIAYVEDRINDIIDMLDFDQPGIIDLLGDLLEFLLGADAPLLSVLEPESAARGGLRTARDNITANLRAPTVMAALEAAVRSSTDARPINVAAWRETLLSRHAFTEDFEAQLARLPLKANRSLSDAGRIARQQLAQASDTLAATVQDIEIQNMRKTSAQDRQSALNRRLNRLRGHLDVERLMRRAQSVRLTAPISVDPKRDDLPVYGRHVYLEIDLGRFDLESAGSPFDLSLEELTANPSGGPADAYGVARRALNRGDVPLDDLAMVELRLFVNGHEIAIDSLKHNMGRLCGTMPPDLLRRGRNDIFLAIAAPTGAAASSLLQHVAFIRDPDRDNRPSNVLTIDPKASVINTQGNDHRDARAGAERDRETVVIQNRSTTQSHDLSDYRIEDAHGHVFTFPPANPLKPGKSETVVVGRPSQTSEHSWIEMFGGRPIAVLNNTGERLLLRAPDGRVVSQMHFGTPTRNPDITFLAPRGAK